MLENPNPFITVNVPIQSALNIPKNSNVRIIIDSYLSKDEIDKVKEEIESNHSPNSIIVVNKHNKEIDNEITSTHNSKLNLRDDNVQQQLIKEFLSTESLTEEQIQKVLDINTKYNLSAEVADDIARNVKWSLESLEWDNLFNYKEGNKIDFSSLAAEHCET